MAIAQTLCTVFKKALLDGEIDFSADTAKTYKIALYTSAATLDASTTAYSATNEVSGTGYTAGGQALTITAPVISGTTAFVDFANPTWSSATITARGALIYDAGNNAAVAVLDFGSDKVSSGGDFVINMPVGDASNAIIRIP